MAIGDSSLAARIPTIHDVARAAGVTTSTVSRALRGEPRVKAATRERIRHIADDLGYRPSRSALALRSMNTRTIGLVVTSMDSPIAIDHLRATVRAAFAVGYTVIVADGQDSAEIQDAELARMLDYRVDGLILGRGTFTTTPSLVRLAAAGIPIEPNIGEGQLRANLGRPTTAYLERTELDAAAATVAYRRLAALGHRRFALFARSRGAFSESRRTTLEQAVSRFGVTGENLISVPIEDPEECIGEVERLSALPNPPTAIISARVAFTPHILEGIQIAGLQIPRDVSFLSFGDSPWHRAYRPSISVIRHDYTAAAARTVQRLVARIEGKAVPELPRRPSEFILRDSFGPTPSEPASK